MSLQHLPTAVPEYPKVNTRMTMLQSLMVSAFTGLAFHVPRASSRGLSRGNVSSQAKTLCGENRDGRKTPRSAHTLISDFQREMQQPEIVRRREYHHPRRYRAHRTDADYDD